MAENELVFGVRQVGAQQAAQEILLPVIAAEEAARRVAALNARLVSQVGARAQAAVAGAQGASFVNPQATEAAVARAVKAVDPLLKINQTLEKGRQEFVSSTIAASEKATGSIVSGYVRQAGAAEASTRRQADAYSKFLAPLEKGRQQFVTQNIEAVEKSVSKLIPNLIKEGQATESASKRAQAEAERAAKSVLTLDQILGRVGGSLRNLGLGLTSLGGSLSIALTAPLAALAAFSASSSKDIDSIRNRLVALEGSIDAANQRLLKNQDLARRSVGVTVELANHSYALFKAIGGIGEQSIERVISAVGRLNAAFSIDDLEKFQRNLVQIFTVNFNQRDIREALRQVPIFNQLLESAFGTSDPDRLRKLKASGKLTLDAFISGLADAVERDPRLSQIGESVGTRLTKTFDRIRTSLAPWGDAILRPIEDAFKALEPSIKRIAELFASLPRPVQTVIVVLGGLFAALGPVLFVVGQLATGVGGLMSAFGRLSALGIAPTIEGFSALYLRMQGTAVVAKEAVVAQAALTASTLKFTAAQGGASVSNSVMAATVVEASAAEQGYRAATDQAAASVARLAVVQRAQALSTAAAATAFVAAAGAIIGVVAIVGAIAFAWVQYSQAQKEAQRVTLEQVNTSARQSKSLAEHQKALEGLKEGTSRTAAEQKTLASAYALLDPASRKRVEQLKAEGKEVAGLSEELRKLIERERERQGFQGVGLAKQFEEDFAAFEKFKRLGDETETELRRLEASLKAAQEQAAKGNILPAEDPRSVQAIQSAIDDLLKQQRALGEEEGKAKEKAEGSAKALAALATATDEGTFKYFEHARALGLVRGRSGDLANALWSLVDAQAGAKEQAADFTDEIDEETKSLKDLRRALQAVEIETKGRSAATKRAFDEDRVNSRAATEALIKDAQKLSEAQVKEIDEFLAAKRKELEAETDDKKRKDAQNAIEDAELRRKKVVSETATEIADLQAAQRRKERQAEEEHQSTLLEIRRTNAQRHIDVLRDRAEKDESLALESERRIVTIERQLSQFEEEEIRRRLGFVAEGTDARRKLEDELSKFLTERARQRAEQGRRVAQAELNDTLRQIREQAAAQQTEAVAAQGQIDRIRDAAERGRTARALVRVPTVERDEETGKLKTVQKFVEVQIKTRADAERAIKDIIDRGFQDRIDSANKEIAALEQNNQSVKEKVEARKQLEQEQANAVEDANRRIREAEEETDPRAEFERAQRAVSLQQTIAAAQLAARESALKAIRSTFGREIELINRRYDVENERVTLAGNQAQDELDRRQRDEEEFWRKNVKTDAEFQQKRLEVQQRFDELRRAEAAKTASEIEALENDRNAELERQDPNSTRSLFGDSFANAAAVIRDAANEAGIAVSNLQVIIGAVGATAAEFFANASAQAGDFLSITLTGIQNLIESVADLAVQFFATGETGSAALKKLLAGVASYYARTWIIKALDNVAEGISNLAKAAAAAASGNLPSAALYKAAAVQNFIAAAKYGLAGAAAGVASGALGAGGRDNGRVASTAVNGGEPSPRNATFNYGGAGPVESASQAARDGSGGTIFERLVAKVEALQQQNLEMQRQQMLVQAQTAQALTHIKSMPHGEALAIGAAQNPAAVGQAVIDHSNASGDFNEHLQKISYGRG